MTSVRMVPGAIDQLMRSEEVAAELGKVAGQVRGRVRAPSRMQVFDRHGVGPRGAFAQVIMRGPGALTVEYGNRTRAPKAPLRGALR